MTYQLKTTGIAAHCITCIAVDPDSLTVKDFASASVTADMTVGANVTIGSQAWGGATRHYYRIGSGTTDADFVKFGTNKPEWAFSSVNNTRTCVFIGEAAGNAARVFGSDSSRYFISVDTGTGGATYPTMYQISRLTGGFAQISAGTKAIFGFSLIKTTSGASFAYADADTGTASKVTSLTATTDASYSINYVNRRNDNTAHQQDKTHAILIFDTALTQAEMDSLRDDWFGVLLESAGGGAVDATATTALQSLTLSAPTATATGTGGAQNGSATATFAAIALSAPAATASGTSASAGTITSQEFKNNAGIVLSSLTVNKVWVIPLSSIPDFSDVVTNTSGQLIVSGASLTAGDDYLLVSSDATGAAVGVKKYTAS